MVVLYREVEDVQLIKKLNAELVRRISAQVPYKKWKVVGYPSGRAEFPVRFERAAGHDVRWWSSTPSENRAAMINLVGSGDPDAKDYLEIDLQFNVPIEKFDRKHGGAFVKELATGRHFIAHRGIVSRGKSRVRRDELILEATHEMMPVLATSGVIDLFVVAPIDSPTLFDDIAGFAREIRRAAKVTMGDERPASDAVSVPLNAGRSSWLDQRLSEYFDEFEGVRSSSGRRASYAFVQHGSVVRQLADALSKFRLQKSKYIDLLAEGSREICVYEVKTDCSPDSLYKAIGQLSLHSIACSKLFKNKVVRKVLVAPDVVSDEFKVMIQRDLHIEVLRFKKKSNGVVEFDGIESTSPVG